MYKLLGLVAMCVMVMGCETRNPICTDNYCLTGEIFPKSELNGRKFDNMPGSISEQQLLNIFSANPNGNIKMVDNDPDIFFINGVVDWVSDDRYALTLEVKINNYDSIFSDDYLKIFIIDYSDNGRKQLPQKVKKGTRHTFKIKPTSADREWSNLDRIWYEYDIFSELVLVM